MHHIIPYIHYIRYKKSFEYVFREFLYIKGSRGSYTLPEVFLNNLLASYGFFANETEDSFRKHF